MSVFQMVAVFLRPLLCTQADLAAENLTYRQQLAALEYSSKRPKLRKRDRIFWAWLSKLWPNWRSVLLIVQPETVVRWHQQGFKSYWRWKSMECRSDRATTRPVPRAGPVRRFMLPQAILESASASQAPLTPSGSLATLPATSMWFSKTIQPHPSN